MLCGIHNAEMTWKTGRSSKTGNEYAFWSCPLRMPDGSYCPFKPQPGAQPSPTAVAPTPSVGNFSKDLDRMTLQEAEIAKNKHIAKSVALKAAVDATSKDRPADDVVGIAQRYFEWLMTP